MPVWLEYVGEDDYEGADPEVGRNILAVTGGLVLVGDDTALALLEGDFEVAEGPPSLTPPDRHEYPQRLIKRSAGRGAFAGGVDLQIGRNVPGCAEGETVLVGHDTADTWATTADWEEVA